MRASGAGQPSEGRDGAGFVKKMVDWGAGPRAGQYLILGGKAVAAMNAA